MYQPGPRAAALHRGRTMDVILHIGAHRCATTTFQRYMRDNAERLRAQGTGFWGPGQTRKGLLNGIAEEGTARLGYVRATRATGRLRMRLAQARARGLKRLIISDENMMGSVRGNLRRGALYPDVAIRMARFAAAMDGFLSEVAVTVRSPENHWASMIGYGALNGVTPPSSGRVEELSRADRSWRHLIAEVSGATPGSPVTVLPFEVFAGRPDAQLRAMTGQPAPRRHHRNWHNATPSLAELRAGLLPRHASRLPAGEGRWFPFDAEQSARLRACYTEDLCWLRNAAGPTVRLVADPDKAGIGNLEINKKQAGLSPPLHDMTRGKPDDDDQRLAGSGRKRAAGPAA